jgi:hypothetical protein
LQDCACFALCSGFDGGIVARLATVLPVASPFIGRLVGNIQTNPTMPHFVQSLDLSTVYDRHVRNPFTPGKAEMMMSPYLIPGAATMAVLGMVYLLFIFWVRRPGRQHDLETRQSGDL